MDDPNTERRVAEFVAACRQEGVTVTYQRMEILRELVAGHEHPDAETIYARLRQRIPTISLDTVYRTLKLLEEKGAIARVGSVRDRARYDANTDRHHHFVCRECGKITDFYSEAIDRLPVPSEVAEMGSVDRVYVELQGRCRTCQAGAKQDRGS